MEFISMVMVSTTEDEWMCVVNMRCIFIVNLMYYYFSIPYVPFYKTILQKSRVLKKVVGVINLSQMYVTISKLPIVYKDLFFWSGVYKDLYCQFSYFKVYR